MPPIPRPKRRPPIDEHVVAEGSRAEIVDGELVLTPPAREPHGTKHFELAYLLGAHVAPGWRGAVDLLVRADEDQDFAPDASIYPAARDPDTGGRQIDALSFEIVGEQPLSVCTCKARALVARGVRRVFCIHLEHDEVLEWYPPTDGWARLDRGAAITDACLASPLPVAALLDAIAADEAVVRALRARDSQAIRALEQESFRRGRAEARRQAVVDLCEVLGVPLTEIRREQLAAMPPAELEALIERLKRRGAWPDGR